MAAADAARDDVSDDAGAGSVVALSGWQPMSAGRRTEKSIAREAVPAEVELRIEVVDLTLTRASIIRVPQPAAAAAVVGAAGDSGYQAPTAGGSAQLQEAGQQIPATIELMEEAQRHAPGDASSVGEVLPAEVPDAGSVADVGDAVEAPESVQPQAEVAEEAKEGTVHTAEDAEGRASEAAVAAETENAAAAPPSSTTVEVPISESPSVVLDQRASSEPSETKALQASGHPDAQHAADPTLSSASANDASEVAMDNARPRVTFVTACEEPSASSVEDGAGLSSMGVTDGGDGVTARGGEAESSDVPDRAGERQRALTAMSVAEKSRWFQLRANMAIASNLASKELPPTGTKDSGGAERDDVIADFPVEGDDDAEARRRRVIQKRRRYSTLKRAAAEASDSDVRRAAAEHKSEADRLVREAAEFDGARVAERSELMARLDAAAKLAAQEAQEHHSEGDGDDGSRFFSVVKEAVNSVRFDSVRARSLSLSAARSSSESDNRAAIGLAAQPRSRTQSLAATFSLPSETLAQPRRSSDSSDVSNVSDSQAAGAEVDKGLVTRRKEEIMEAAERHARMLAAAAVQGTGNRWVRTLGAARARSGSGDCGSERAAAVSEASGGRRSCESDSSVEAALDAEAAVGMEAAVGAVADAALERNVRSLMEQVVTMRAELGRLAAARPAEVEAASAGNGGTVDRTAIDIALARAEAAEIAAAAARTDAAVLAAKVAELEDASMRASTAAVAEATVTSPAAAGITSGAVHSPPSASPAAAVHSARAVSPDGAAAPLAVATSALLDVRAATLVTGELRAQPEAQQQQQHQQQASPPQQDRSAELLSLSAAVSRSAAEVEAMRRDLAVARAEGAAVSAALASARREGARLEVERESALTAERRQRRQAVRARARSVEATAAAEGATAQRNTMAADLEDIAADRDAIATERDAIAAERDALLAQLRDTAGAAHVESEERATAAEAVQREMEAMGAELAALHAEREQDDRAGDDFDSDEVCSTLCLL